MAGSLVQVDTFTVSSAVSSIIIGGGTDSSSGIDFEINTDDVYMLTAVGIKTATDNTYTKLRVTKSDGSGGASADTTSNYDLAYEVLRADAAFSTNEEQNEAEAYINHSLGTGTSELGNFIIYLYNFNSSSEYSFGSVETCDVRYDTKLMSRTGGFAHTVASASNGVQLYMSSGNIAGGTFTLYRMI